MRTFLLTIAAVVLTAVAAPAAAQSALSKTEYGPWMLVSGGTDTGCLATYKSGDESFHLYAGPISDGALIFHSSAIAAIPAGGAFPIELSWYVPGGRPAVATLSATPFKMSNTTVLFLEMPLDAVTEKLPAAPRMAGRADGKQLFDITLPTGADSRALYSAFLACQSRVIGD
jgi:hypothetical protein